ncbi:DUF6750 family protein [Xenorhabdus stockiae]|uniref:DUF6750 family protein n=1 Tax=Xenorhabdus stockiae TaxID=351614 RepID=UPI00406411B9
MLTKVYNVALKMKTAFKARKYQLMVALYGLLLLPSAAHAETIWDNIRSWGDGLKSIREPIMWGAGTAGIVIIISGLFMIKNVNDAKKQGQTGGRSMGTAVIAILIGAFLVGLAAFIKIATGTAGVESSL